MNKPEKKRNGKEKCRPTSSQVWKSNTLSTCISNFQSQSYVLQGLLQVPLKCVYQHKSYKLEIQDRRELFPPLISMKQKETKQITVLGRKPKTRRIS